MAKKKGWIRFRHKVTVEVLRYTLGIYARWKYGIRVEPFPQQGSRPYLILMNHQTAFDQFFVGMTFNRPVYYLATEDIFSMGWVSKLIRLLVAPIPIKKQTMDLQAVKNCIKVAREGGTICLAPEGNRTFHGRTVYINPSVASLAKKLELPVVIFRIEGGYGVHPRWADKVRKGKMRSYVKCVIEPEQLRQMTHEELSERICRELYVDEGCVSGEFHHKKNAEFLERAMYYCPDCGLSRFDSRGDVIACTACGMQVRHLATKELEGVGKPFPYRFVADWYDAQCDYVNQLDLLSMTGQPLYDEDVSLYRVYPHKRKELLLKKTRLRLYGDRIAVADRAYPMSGLQAVVVLGKNKLNLYTQDEVLQIRGGKRFNALKYVNLYHRHKNLTTGDPNGKFLGL